MAMKQSSHVIKGMQRDLTVSKFSPEYAYENMNIRITAREHSTLLSVTNEKGTKEISVPSFRQPNKIIVEPTGKIVMQYPLASSIRGGILTETSDGVQYKYEIVLESGQSESTAYEGHLPITQSVKGFYFIDDLVYDDTYQYWSDLHPLGFIPGGDIKGVPLGSCTIGKYIVIFTKDEAEGIDYIYRLEGINDYFEVTILYQGNLNFSTAYPIQTLGTYENENIQKVYWVDGLNQSRVINIVAEEGTYNGNDKFDFIRGFNTGATTTVEKVPSGTGIFPSGVVQYALTYYNSYAQESTVFYISPLFYTSPTGRGGRPDEVVNNEFRIMVNNPDTNFDGINIYSIIRTSLDGTPSVKRVASVELKAKYSIYNKLEISQTYDYTTQTVDPSVVEVFKSGSKALLTDYPYDEVDGKLKWRISVEGDSGIIINKQYDPEHEIYFLDFDKAAGGVANITYDPFTHQIKLERKSPDYGYIFVYVASISNRTYVDYSDNNTTGETLDPTELLYKGGEEVVPYTITQKDNTLFLGNLTIKRSAIPQDIRLGVGDLPLTTEGKDVTVLTPEDTDVYPYKSNLSFDNGVITSFKQGETYRPGLVFLHRTGKWSEAIPIRDFEVDRYITAESYNKIVSSIGSTLINRLIDLGYVAVKPVMVYPSYTDRTVVCQGIINPTLFKANDRPDNSPYSISSWFFRPLFAGSFDDGGLDWARSPRDGGVVLEFRHKRPLPSSFNFNGEIQSQDCISDVSTEAGTSTCPDESEGNFKVDGSICTFHSPDIEFDETVKSLVKNCQIRYVGYAKCKANYSDYSIIGPNSFLKTTRSSGSNYRIINHDYSTMYTKYGGANYWNGSANERHSSVKKICALPVYVDGVLTRRDPNKNDDWDVLGNDGGYGNWINCAWIVYPWHREASLNNDMDKTGTEGQSLVRTGQYTKKILSNLQYTDTYYIDKEGYYHMSTPPTLYLEGDSQFTGIAEVAVFDSNEDTIIKLPIIKNALDGQQIERVYRGNYNGYHGGTSYLFTMCQMKGQYNPNVANPLVNPGALTEWRQPYTNDQHYWNGSTISGLASEYGRSQSWDMLAQRWQQDGTVYPVTNTTDIVPIRFKSTPHAVIQFNNTTYGQQAAMPVLGWNGGDYWNKGDLPTRSKGYDIQIVSSFGEATNTNVRAFIKEASSTENQLFGKMYKYNTTSKEWEEEEMVADPYTQYRAYSVGTLYVLVKKPSMAYKQYLAPITDDVKSTSRPFGPRAIMQQRVDIIGNTSSQKGGELGDYDGGYIIVDMYRPVVENRFGGTGDAAYTNNIWHPAGSTVNFYNVDGTVKPSVNIEYTEGDTFFQRYDCLKTYPWSNDEKNQIVDLTSFMCETRVNIDGRYDRNRGNKSNLTATPENFNLLNPVYSQKNNFFTYNYTSRDISSIDRFPNTVTWTSEKTNGSVVDTWTNITLASTLDLDGDKGEVISLNTLNNEIFCFQEQGLSNIIFNPRVQIPVSDGVPVEIGNNYKVQGKRYVSNLIGCSNKWSICQTPAGIYFIDNLTNGLYTFDGQSISSLSDKLGFRQFIGANNSLDKWNPVDFKNFRTFYDKTNDDVYFINDKYCLAYSELIGQFTSFMSYEKTPVMLNYRDKFYAVNKNKVWEINGGDYNMFYGEFKPFYVTIVANQDEPVDKIFNTVEYRADVKRDGELMPNETFTQLDVWNEYQHGTLELVNRVGYPSPLKRKFRIWRANIPRDNGNRNRIRNTWAYIKLQMNKESTDSMELHDIGVSFFE